MGLHHRRWLVSGFSAWLPGLSPSTIRGASDVGSAHECGQCAVLPRQRISEALGTSPTKRVGRFALPPAQPLT